MKNHAFWLLLLSAILCSSPVDSAPQEEYKVECSVRYIISHFMISGEQTHTGEPIGPGELENLTKDNLKEKMDACLRAPSGSNIPGCETYLVPNPCACRPGDNLLHVFRHYEPAYSEGSTVTCGQSSDGGSDGNTDPAWYSACLGACMQSGVEVGYCHLFCSDEKNLAANFPDYCIGAGSGKRRYATLTCEVQ